MQHTILIIDDNADDALLTKMVLLKTSRDIRAEVALSGEAGLELMRGGKILPALILLDLKMPGMDGIEVLRKIRDDKHLSNIPVVIVTHSDLLSDERACVEAGTNHFLHKATNIDQFKKEIDFVLENWLDTNKPNQ